MSASITTKELRNSQVKDLERDVRAQKALAAKLRMGIKLQKEKDSAKYKREKKAIARMMTVLTEKMRGGGEEKIEKSKGLRGKVKSPKISAPKS